MKNLLWQANGTGWTTNDAGTVFPLATKPAFSFTYDALYHEFNNEFFVLNGVRTDLTADQITEIDNFIATVEQTNAADVMGVDAKGMYLGWVPANQAYKAVNSAPWSNDAMRYDFNTNTWLRVQAVDKDGKYLGNVPLNDPNFYEDVQSTPTFTYEVWDFAARAWKDGRTLAELKADLCTDIDAQADDQSLHYVTPGYTQSARYQEKLTQCQNYKAAGYPYSDYPAQIDSAAYPYVYWEANQTHATDATVTGKSMADGVIEQATVWGVKGGMIEGYRIGGKKAVNAAADASSATTAHGNAIINIRNV